MEKIKNAIKGVFNGIKWWEYLYMAAFIAVIIACGVVFKSSALVIINAIVSSLAIFFIAKGKVLGNILGIAQCTIYSIISYFNSYYGEMILCLCITLPVYCVSIITWIKNLRKQEKVVKINKMLSIKEWAILFAVVLASSVGIYYLLEALNTANLIISTVNVSINMISGYLLIRRCEYNFIFFIISNVVSITLWATVIAAGGLDSVPTLVMFAIFLLLNIMGFINWLRLKKSQAKDGAQENKITQEKSQTVEGK